MILNEIINQLSFELLFLKHHFLLNFMLKSFYHLMVTLILKSWFHFFLSFFLDFFKKLCHLNFVVENFYFNCYCRNLILEAEKIANEGFLVILLYSIKLNFLKTIQVFVQNLDLLNVFCLSLAWNVSYLLESYLIYQVKLVFSKQPLKLIFVHKMVCQQEKHLIISWQHDLALHYILVLAVKKLLL